MKSVFVPKTVFPFDAAVYERMRQTAANILQEAEQSQCTQALVLFSSAGNEYGALIKDALSEEKADETALLEGLTAEHDTEVRYVLCMWQDKCLDIPSLAFRNMLCALDPHNTDALLFVATRTDVCAIKLAGTLK